MGSTDKSRDEITILVTGFGPFKDHYPRNPSWDIASSLPTYLPAPNARSSTTARGLSPSLPPIRVVIHPEPVRVTYSAVRQLVPSLWPPKSDSIAKIDYMLHIGMASAKNQYVLEQLGHRDGYKMLDLDEKVPRENPSDDDYPWHGIPAQLTTDLDVADIKRRWELHAPNNVLLRTSEDAGHFLCDYIYFNSLAACHRAKEKKRVLFLHVPAVRAEPSESYRVSIELGREVAIQLLRSIVESDLAAHRENAAAVL